MATRVFRGCRALLAPAATSVSNSSATAAAAKPKRTTAVKAKAKPESSAGPRTTVRATGILKVTPISPALAQFMGASEASRTEAVKQIWSYIKSNNLQDPTDKRQIFCDEKLKSLFDGKDKVGFLEIGKLLSRHFVKAA